MTGERRLFPSSPADTTARRAITAQSMRAVRRGATALAVVAGGMSAVVAMTYAGTIQRAPGGAASLHVLALNPAIRTLFGEPIGLDTAGGFTVWRTGAALGVVMGTWALLTVVRLLRGEEDAGRWTLLLLGPLSAARVTLRVVAVVGAVPLLAGTVVSVALVATGNPVRGAVLHGLGLAMIGVWFAVVGAMTAQFVPRRAGAGAAAVAVLIIGLLLRMIGDGVSALGWVRWLSPFGLTALAAPFHADRTLPLVVLAAGSALLLLLVPVLVGCRDVGDGFTAVRVRASRLWFLGSVSAFAARRAARPWLGWAAAVVVFFGLIGSLAVSLTGFSSRIRGSRSSRRPAGSRSSTPWTATWRRCRRSWPSPPEHSPPRASRCSPTTRPTADSPSCWLGL